MADQSLNGPTSRPLKRRTPLLSLFHPPTDGECETPAPSGDWKTNDEFLTITRLPGEALGMECDVIAPSDEDSRQRVVVRRVVGTSPAQRPSDGARGLEVGDDIIAINGVELSTVSRVQILQFIRETPLTVRLLVRRGQSSSDQAPNDDGYSRHFKQTGMESDGVSLPGYALQTCKPSIVHDGFELRQLTFHKLTAQPLALELQQRTLNLHTYQQVVGVLPESVFYNRRLLKHGDYIAAVNGQPVEDLTTQQCYRLLNHPSDTISIELLRKIEPNTKAASLPNSRADLPADIEQELLEDQLDFDHEPSVTGRWSSMPELNQNELFAKAKLRLSYHPDVDSWRMRRLGTSANDEKGRSRSRAPIRVRIPEYFLTESTSFAADSADDDTAIEETSANGERTGLKTAEGLYENLPLSIDSNDNMRTNEKVSLDAGANVRAAKEFFESMPYYVSRNHATPNSEAAEIDLKGKTESPTKEELNELVLVNGHAADNVSLRHRSLSESSEFSTKSHPKKPLRRSLESKDNHEFNSERASEENRPKEVRVTQSRFLDRRLSESQKDVASRLSSESLEAPHADILQRGTSDRRVLPGLLHAAERYERKTDQQRLEHNKAEITGTAKKAGSLPDLLETSQKSSPVFWQAVGTTSLIILTKTTATGAVDVKSAQWQVANNAVGGRSFQQNLPQHFTKGSSAGSENTAFDGSLTKTRVLIGEILVRPEPMRLSKYPTLKLYISYVTISKDTVLLTTRVTPATYESYLPCSRVEGQLFQVCVVQDHSTGLGVGVSLRPAGVIFCDIVDTGPVGKNGNVRVGDILVAVNGVDVTPLSEDEVQHLLATVPPGPVQLIIFAQHHTQLQQLHSAVIPSMSSSCISRLFFPTRFDGKRETGNAGLEIAGLETAEKYQNPMTFRVLSEEVDMFAVDDLPQRIAKNASSSDSRGPVTHVLDVNTLRIKIFRVSSDAADLATDNVSHNYLLFSDHDRGDSFPRRTPDGNGRDVDSFRPAASGVPHIVVHEASDSDSEQDYSVC